MMEMFEAGELQQLLTEKQVAKAPPSGCGGTLK
jgi:hypothetical protein